MARKAENIYCLALFRKRLPIPDLDKLGFCLHGLDLQGGDTYSIISVQEIICLTIFCATEETCGVSESV